MFRREFYSDYVTCTFITAMQSVQYLAPSQSAKC